MDFGGNKTPVKIIKEGAFRGTYFRDIHSGINGKWYRKSWKEFDELKNIDQNYYCSKLLVLINMVLNLKHHYDFGKIKDGFILLILMVGFSGILDIG